MKILTICVCALAFVGQSWYSANNILHNQTITVSSMDKKGLINAKPYILGRLDGQKLDITDYQKGIMNVKGLSMNEKIICDGLTERDKKNLIEGLNLSFTKKKALQAQSLLEKDMMCQIYLSRMRGDNGKVVSAYAMSAVYLDSGVSRLTHCGILKLFSLSNLDTSKVNTKLQPSKTCDVKKIGVITNFNRHPLKKAEILLQSNGGK